MSNAPDGPTDEPLPPNTTALLLATFADQYRQELSAAEDVYRTLPFFGTALGIVVTSAGYVASLLPKWSNDASCAGRVAFLVAAALFGLAVKEGGFVLYWLKRAIENKDFPRMPAEPDFRNTLRERRENLAHEGVPNVEWDNELVKAAREALLKSYTEGNPAAREVNRQRYQSRANASMHLIQGLIWVLCATTVIFAADKLSFFQR
jgi:hypothetical protein